MKISLDIVLPCYNPHENWHFELLRFHAEAKERYDLTYFLVDDGSENTELKNSIPLLEKEGVRLNFISYSINYGKGYALREGVRATKSKFVLYTDVDFPFTNESTLKLAEVLTSGKFDVVAGRREAEYYLNKMSGFRKYLSKCFRWVLRRLLRMQITDTQCGLKGFNALGKEEFLKTRVNRYLFDFEFIYRASRRKGLKLCPVNVELKPNVVFRKMPLSILVQEFANLFRVLFFTKFTG